MLEAKEEEEVREKMEYLRSCVDIDEDLDLMIQLIKNSETRHNPIVFEEHSTQLEYKRIVNIEGMNSEEREEVSESHN